MDAVLIIGALTLSPILGFALGLHWWGVVVSPLLHLAAALTMLWAARPLLRRDQLWLAGFFFAIQPGVIGYLQFGRPDHHGLLILTSVLYLGAGLRVVTGASCPRNTLIMGFVGSFGVWVSIQFLSVLVIPLVALGLFWLAGVRATVPAARRLSTGLVVGTAAALALERGWSRLMVQEFDTLSISHLLLFGLTLVFWVGLEVQQRRCTWPLSLGRRIGIAVLGSGVFLSLLWLLAPDFFASPLAEVDPLYRAKRLVLIKELQPAILFGPDGVWTWSKTVSRPLFWVGISLPALPWLLYRLRWGSATERRLYLLLGLGAAVHLPLALNQLRWTPEVAVFLAPVYAALAAALLDVLVGRLRPALVPIARPLATSVLGLWIFIPLGWSLSAARVSTSDAEQSACRPETLARWLGDPQAAGQTPKHLLVFPDLAPRLLYRTPHAVNAIPNHRSQPGFAAAIRIMTATDFTEAAVLLRARGIDAIVTCPGPLEDRLYKVADGEPTLYRALKKGQPPPFLEPVEASKSQLGGYKVFSVHDETDSSSAAFKFE
ncbi:MAG TPA: hypothetical protein VLS27_03230 [Gammaproteobacteria bacterium]|nr:hypothetical protein [Gammaproteobacteria bacterium]